MPNIGKMLKDEIQRLARKELKAALVGLRRDNVALKHAVADYKRRITTLERSNRRTAKVVGPQLEAASMPSPEAADRARITGGMVRRIREKLGLSQADFARLVNVNSQSVYQWEHKPGRLNFRGGTKNAILEVRRTGVREARRRLEALEDGTAANSRDGRQRRIAKAAEAGRRKPGRPSAQEMDDARITGRAIRAMRKKLGISQVDLARLLDLHTQTVYQWEHKPGPLQFRGNTKAGILAVQRMGAQEIRKRLEAMNEASAKKRAPRRRKRRKA